MKLITVILCLLSVSFLRAQSLPIDFEVDISTSDFTDFDGGTATVAANPLMAGINLSDSVGCIIRDGGAVWAGSKIALSQNLDFTSLTILSMKVYTTAPIGTTVKFKLEGSGNPAEVDAFTTTTGEWETLEWVFAGTGNDLNELVFMFDFGNTGDGGANSTFYFDDIEQLIGPPAPVPTSLPIDFESGVADSDFFNFAGAVASVIVNPQMTGINTSATVCQIVRNNGEIYAGSKILLENNLDLSTEWHMSMKFFTEAPVGTLIKLKLEGQDVATSLDVYTSVSGDWETLNWNFDGQENPYNSLTFMFDYGNVGDSTSASTFLFDDVQQFAGEPLPTPLPATIPIDFENSVVSSDFTNFFGGTATVVPNPQMNGINTSPTVGRFFRSGGQSWAQSSLALTQFMDYSTLSTITMKVYTDAPVGTLLKLKVESTETPAANERDAYTTVSGEWATYTFDFAGDPPVYNVLTFMLGYGSIGDASPNSTFLFDDIEQVDPTTVGLESNSAVTRFSFYPNPATDQLTISSAEVAIRTISIFDVLGNEVLSIAPQQLRVTLDVSDFASGIYVARISTQAEDASSSLTFKVD